MDAVAPIRRSRMQFRMELALFIASGIATTLILYAIYRFPIIQSGLKLALGIFTVELFAALDLALARERLVIGLAQRGRISYSPPKELSPMTRKFSLVSTLILLLITGIIMLVMIRDVNWLAEQDLSMSTVDALGRSVLIEILFVMGFLLVMVVNLVFSYARNLRILFENETDVLEKVSRGDLTRRVPVATSDELGVIAGHTNIMIKALREGTRMREGLLIAQEVQQHLLPEAPPDIHGLDLAGVSLFSDETGGDYYDFIDCETESCRQTVVTVGDVSGHGVGAALLMAAGRAVIRQNAHSTDSPVQAIARANRHLARDIGDTGRFMTLFYLTIDPVLGSLSWVNAGHQPPLYYDPETDSFSELKGEDIPLGVVEEWEFHERFMDMPTRGRILLLGTDGAWEARNRDGEMFGGDGIQRVLRANRDRSAEEILHAICDAVTEFTGSRQPEDDLTLVVIKGTGK